MHSLRVIFQSSLHLHSPLSRKTLFSAHSVHNYPKSNTSNIVSDPGMHVSTMFACLFVSINV